MANKLFDYIEITYDKLTDQLERWLKETYQKSDKVFSHMSPSGMIMHIQKILFNNNLLYLRNALRQVDIETTDNKRVVLTTARISGHNPSRAISATGTIKLRLKIGIDIQDEIKGSKIVIMNNTLMKNKSNSLYYVINTGDSIKNVYDVNAYTDLYFNVKQGKYETQTYTGDATKNQSIAVIVDRDQVIDNFSFSVYYNGNGLKIVDSLYDMLPNEYACYTKTGFDGGLDIYFGTGDHGFVPAIGSVITVTYLVTDGADGNILTNLVNDFTFEDDVYDANGNVLGMDELFDIYIHNDINFGADGESIEYTKSIIPNVSRNFVLATPEQFIYHLKRLNMFSKVNAYNLLDTNNFNNNKYIESFIVETFGDTIDIDKVRDNMEKYFPTIYDNQIYIYLIPKIENYFVGDYNYFNIPFDVFYLDEQEKEKVMTYLKRLGTLSITSNVIIIQPKISLYVANVYVRRFTDDVTDNISNQIIDVMSNYFIYNERFDRIIKSDLIKTLKNEISSIDSVNIEFVCKKNEEYHREGTASKSGSTFNVLEDQVQVISQRKVYVKTQYNPDALLGIDPVQGDIVVDKDELAVLRGGWYDRYGVYYNDTETANGLSSINIIWTGNYDDLYSSTKSKKAIKPTTKASNLTRQVSSKPIAVKGATTKTVATQKSTSAK
jgi:hypothetical protein